MSLIIFQRRCSTLPETQVAPYYVHLCLICRRDYFYFVAGQRVGWNIFSLEKLMLLLIYFNLRMRVNTGASFGGVWLVQEILGVSRRLNNLLILAW